MCHTSVNADLFTGNYCLLIRRPVGYFTDMYKYILRCNQKLTSHRFTERAESKQALYPVRMQLRHCTFSLSARRRPCVKMSACLSRDRPTSLALIERFSG